eukprot:jgi/Mesvir1/14445/Mv05127-RA.1
MTTSLSLLGVGRAKKIYTEQIESDPSVSESGITIRAGGPIGLVPNVINGNSIYAVTPPTIGASDNRVTVHGDLKVTGGITSNGALADYTLNSNTREPSNSITKSTNNHLLLEASSASKDVIVQDSRFVAHRQAITTASAAVPTPDTASVRAKNGAENREIALGLVYNTSNTFNGANATGRTLWRGVIDSTIADMEIVSDTQMRVSSDRDATGQVRLGAGSAIVLAPKIVTPGGDPSTKILVQSEALENLGVTPVTDTRRNHTYSANAVTIVGRRGVNNAGAGGNLWITGDTDVPDSGVAVEQAKFVDSSVSTTNKTLALSAATNVSVEKDLVLKSTDGDGGKISTTSGDLYLNPASGVLKVNGDVHVDGTLTSVNTTTTRAVVMDKTLSLANLAAGPTNAGADGAGIVVEGNGVVNNRRADRSIRWSTNATQETGDETGSYWHIRGGQIMLTRTIDVAKRKAPGSNVTLSELPVRNGATTEPHLWKMNASVDTTAPWRTADSVSGLYLTYSNTVQPDHASVPGFFSTKYGTSGYNVSNYRATGFTRPGDIISPGTGMLFTGVVKPVTSFEFATGGPSVNNPGAALSAPFTCTVPGSSNTNVNMVEICTVGDATTAGRYVSAWVWRSGRILVFNGYSYNETVDPVVSDAEFTFGIGLIGTSPTVYVNGQKPAMSGWRSMDTNESTSTNVNVSLSSAATTPGATTTTLTGATSVPLGVNLDGAFTLVINFKTPTGSFDADLTNNPNLNEYVYFYIGDNGSSDNNTSIAMGTRNGGVWFKVANMQTATVADDLVIRSLLRMEPGEDVSVSITRTVDSNGNAIYRWTVNDVAVLGNETYGSSLPLFSYNTGYAGAYHIFGTVTPEYPNGTPLNTPLGGQAPVCETTFDAMGTLTTNSGGILPYLTIANGGLQGGSGDLNIGNEQGLWTMTGGSGNVGSVSAGSLVTFGTFTVTGNQLQANTSSTNADYASIDLSNAGFNGALGTFTISVAYRHPSTAPVDANDASSVLFYGDPSGAYIGLYHDLNGILHIKTSTGDVATNANVMDGVEHSIVLSRLTTADGGAIGTITLPTTWPGEWGFNNTLNNIGTGTSGSFTTSGTTLSTTDLIIPLTTAGAGGSVQAIDLNTQGSTTNDGLGAFMVETRMKTGQINTYDYYHILTVGDNFATGSTGNAIRLVLSGGIFFFMTIWPGSTGTSASQGYYATIATSKLALATGTGDPENMNYHTYRIARKATSTGVASAETIYQFWYDDIEVPWTNANWRFAAPNNVNVTATRSLYNPVLKSPTSNYIRVGRTLFNTTTNTSWMVDYVRFKNDILVPGPIVTPTYNGMYRLYVDGQSITIPTAPPELGNVSIATKTLTMGKYGYPSRDSVWDNIRFLNRALTTSEAQQLGKAVFPQYYRMSNASLPGANANFAISVDYTPPNDAPRPATSCKELYSTTADRSLRANCNRTSG